MPLGAAPTGVLPVIQTPYAPDGTIDETQLRSEIRWVLDEGADGITTGMVSEILRLTHGERRHLTEVVCELAGERGCVAVISVGDESLRSATEHAEHAERNGATALMANPPVTMTLDDRALYEYYSRILESVSLPVIVQDASGYIGRPLSIDMLASLQNAYGEQVFFKPEAQPRGQRLSMLREATGGAARAFDGIAGAPLVDSFRRGIIGTMPGSELVWAIRRIWDALVSGDWALAYAISGPLNALVSLQTTVDSFVAVEKHLLLRQGVLASTYQRPPCAYLLDPETTAEIERLFNQIARAAKQPDRVISVTADA